MNPDPVLNQQERVLSKAARIVVFVPASRGESLAQTVHILKADLEYRVMEALEPGETVSQEESANEEKAGALPDDDSCLERTRCELEAVLRDRVPSQIFPCR